MGHALVLNASFEPLHVISWQKAMQLLFQGKVEVLEESNQVVRTVSFSFKVPSVLRLLTYIPLKRKKQIIRFSRNNVFARDQFTCQYCGCKFPRTSLTLDHVIPIVQGGKKSWENIVTACKTCNQRKGGRTPSQAGMSLFQKPNYPAWLPTMNINMSFSLTPESWKIYLSMTLLPPKK